jgi:beta-galactosidase
MFDGKPFEIISGEMHYARMPRAYWRDRLEKARAMGLNTISTYVVWNLHEPLPGAYDFGGQLDVAEFIRQAQLLDLKDDRRASLAGRSEPILNELHQGAK